MKKIYAVIFLSVLLLGFILTVSNTFKRKESGINPEQLAKEYDSVISMIKNGTISVKSNGCVFLPDEFKYLSDSGECFVIQFNDKTALYFYSFRGILDSSKGYIYTTDKISYKDYIDTESYVSSMDFTNIVELSENLFFGSTE